MKKIKDYEILTGRSIPDLVAEVLKYLAHGWQPFGAPSSFANPDESFVMQAVVIYEE